MMKEIRCDECENIIISITNIDLFTNYHMPIFLHKACYELLKENAGADK